MKITVFGAGYVGLVTGACLAELGNHVMIVEINQEKLAILQKGISPIYEPGLTHLLQTNQQAGRLIFTNHAREGVQHGEYLFIAVGTPSDPQGAADLQYVFSVAKTIGQHLNQPAIVVSKSTVPVGTAEQIRDIIQQELQQRKINFNFAVVSNPEFLKEGSAVTDFNHPDRIIIGADDEHALQRMRKLYAPLLKSEQQFVAMGIRSAELAKYVSNTFLATKISFMNEISHLAEAIGADIEDVRRGIGSDIRIGPHFLSAGCGYGGSCFPKDILALHKMAKEQQCELSILAAAEQVNLRQKQILHQKIAHYFNHNLSDKVIAVWGLSFKPNTDDMREASSRILIEALWQSGAQVQAYDPAAVEEAQRIYGQRSDLKLFQNANEALQGADVLAIVTEWEEFRQPDFQLIKQMLRHPVIFDGRNLYEPNHVAEQGIQYFAIGRKTTALVVE
ncbi:MAG: UDP-glucose/GDP-mannose dehydrogenase family protein [Gammaproteobacteria bacterium]